MNRLLHSEKEFAELYALYGKTVYQLCRSYLNDNDIAKDLLQETFISVWRNRAQFRAESSIQTWICRIAVNTCLGYIRNTKRKSKTLHEANIKQDQADESIHEDDHAVSILYRAIQRLEETDRLIISFVLQEIPYPEIAEVMSIQEGNLRVKIHRIKKQLAAIHQSIQNQ